MDQILPFLSAVVDLAKTHAWIPLAALLIGAIVRVLKSDVPLPSAVVPSQYRPALALGLGVVAGVVEAVAAGKPWRAALLEGLAAGALAIVGHAAVVDGARGGRDIGVPKDAAITPKPRGVARLHTLGFVACLGVATAMGCARLLPVIHAAEGACSVVPLLLSDGTASAVCVVIEDLAALVELLAKAERAGKAARFELAAADGSKRIVEVSAGHVPQAHAEAKAAHARASR